MRALPTPGGGCGLDGSACCASCLVFAILLDVFTVPLSLGGVHGAPLFLFFTRRKPSVSASSDIIGVGYNYENVSNQLRLSRFELAALSASCEQYIGTQGGGMDQAIAFLGTKGCAKLIEFNPLRDSNVKLPSEAVFVISHSLTMLAKKSGLAWEKLTRLADLHKVLGFTLEEMVQLVRDVLHEAPYSKREAILFGSNYMTFLEVRGEFHMDGSWAFSENSRCITNFADTINVVNGFQQILHRCRLHTHLVMYNSKHGVKERLPNTLRNTMKQ
ncbi:UNVERIFIED_CONTAM: hypothetical protein B566_EDAN017903 [Ephemera danica]|nr:hypothetical protein B566_EDAN017903 [Ephemera danica]